MNARKPFSTSVNAPALGAAAFGYLSQVFVPEPGDYMFGDWTLAAFSGLAGLAAAAQAVAGARNDFMLRRAMSNASIPSGAHGQARFANTVERQAAGFHDPAGTLLLGLADGLPIFAPKQSHVAIQATTGAGKTTALMAGAALHALQTGRSVVLSDPKPELVFLWARAFGARGFRVVVNNPAQLDLGDLVSTNSNPLAGLINAAQNAALHRDAFTLAESIARTLVPGATNDKNRFFTETDRSILIAVMLSLAAFEPENCYPAQVWRAVTDPRRFKDLMHLAGTSEFLGGDLAAIAAAIQQKARDNPEHLESGRTGAAQSLSVFKPSSTLGMVGQCHEFDPRDLRDPTKPPVALFDIIPVDRLDVFAKANELNQVARLSALKRHREGREVVFLLDEATNLRVPQIVSDVEILRSFNVRLVLAFQSWAGLKAAYGEEQAVRLRANCLEVFFSVSDLSTADDISKRIGDTTIKTEGVTFGEGRPSRNFGETAHKLLPPEEILSLPRDTAIALAPGLRPILFRKVPWFEIEPYKSIAGENPHERHPKSPITRLRLNYGRDADELRAPGIPDLKQRLARAISNERLAHRRPRVPIITAKKLRWLPIVAGAAFVISTLGTPHVLLPVNLGFDAGGRSRCAYLGLEGMQHVASSAACPAIKMLPHSQRDGGGVLFSLLSHGDTP